MRDSHQDLSAGFPLAKGEGVVRDARGSGERKEKVHVEFSLAVSSVRQGRSAELTRANIRAKMPNPLFSFADLW